MGCLTPDAARRWPNAVVPIAFDPNTIPMGDPLIGVVQAATMAWQARTPLVFVTRTTEADFVQFRKDASAVRCNSDVGRQGGAQEIRCAANATPRRIIHELGHAVGLEHEHQRLDRDAMVAVSQRALQLEPQNYERRDEALLIGPYDFGSIMHYRTNDGTARGMMTKLHPDPPPPGFANIPSAGDENTAQFMYGIVTARSPIAAHGRNNNHMEVWVVDAFGTVRGAWWNGQWQTWYLLGDATFPQNAWLAAAGRTADHQEVWGIDNAGALRGRWWDGAWHDWYLLGGPPPVAGAPPGAPTLPAGAPLVAHSRNPNHMEVWAVGVDGQLHGTWWDGNNWQSWYTLAGRTFPPRAQLAVHARNDDHMELWAIGTDFKLHGIWWDGSWQPWYTIDVDASFEPGGGVAAIGRNDDHMEVWSVDGRHTLKGAWWDGNWHGYALGGPTPLPGGGTGGLPPGAPIAALSRGDDYMDVWCVGEDARLHGTWWDGNWHGWYVVDPTPVPALSPLAAHSRNDDHQEIWCVAPDDPRIHVQGVQGTWWNGNWNPFYRVV